METIIFDMQPDSSCKYDIVICGGGIAGLWLLNILHSAGFDVLLVEKEALGGMQTIASQGMIHGGQRYLLGPNPSTHANCVASLPDRWDACFSGQGELDLSSVKILSETQVMWPTGGLLSHMVASTATRILQARARKLEVPEVPAALSGLVGVSVYELPEKVVDVDSLVKVLSAPHTSRIRRGDVDSLESDGRLTVSGVQIQAQVIVCAAGLGNEDLLKLMGVGKGCTQQRPLRQLMVKPMPFPLYGHGITTSYKPRVTITSHPLPSGGYVWYIGGAIADDSLILTEEDAIAFAKKELKAIFYHLDLTQKQWSTWFCVRGEARSKDGRLPNGPVIQEYGNTLAIWPTKLTLAPILGDLVLARLIDKRVLPKNLTPRQMPDKLALPHFSQFPWEQVIWH
jgi:hypothetical protein